MVRMLLRALPLLAVLLLASSATAEEVEPKQAIAFKVPPEVREYCDTAMNSYTIHVKPRVTTAKKIYFQVASPYVGVATDTIYAGVNACIGAAMQGGKTFSRIMWNLLQNGVKKMLPAMPASGAAQSFVDPLGLLAQFRSITTLKLLGSTRTFGHDFLDICLTVLQAMCVSYVAFLLVGKLFLKTFVWKIGVKFFGARFSMLLVKVIYALLQNLFHILLMVSGVLLIRVVLPLGVGGGLGVGLVHALDKNFSTGLSAGLRLGLGGIAGTLVWTLAWLQVRYCCRKRSACESEQVPLSDPSNNQEGPAAGVPTVACRSPSRSASPAAARKAAHAVQNGDLSMGKVEVRRLTSGVLKAFDQANAREAQLSH